jgi:hypothetical protein
MVGSDFCQSVAAAGGFLVSASGDLVVDPHEVGILHKSGYDVARMVPLNHSPYPVDGQKAFLRGSVVPVRDFVQSIVEVADG